MNASDFVDAAAVTLDHRPLWQRGLTDDVIDDLTDGQGRRPSRCRNVDEGRNRHRWTPNITLSVACFCLAFLIHGITVTVHVLFSSLAEDKGLETYEVTIVTSVYLVALTLIQPLSGYMVTDTSSLFGLKLGLFILGGSSLIFGSLEFWPHGDGLFWAALVASILMAFGSAFVLISITTMVSLTFPPIFGSIIALVQLAALVGITVGPTIGHTLDQVANFKGPFYLIGCSLLLLGICSHLVVAIEEVSEEVEFNIIQCLSSPDIFFNMLTIAVGSVVFGFNNSTLKQNINDVTQALTDTEIALAVALIYVFSTLSIGLICDKVEKLYGLVLLGITTCLVAFVFSGPIYPLAITSHLWVVIVTQALIGVGFSLQTIPAFVRIYRDAETNDLPHTFGTFTSLSVLANMSLVGGITIGSVVGNSLLTPFGYQKACVFALAVQAFMFIIVVLYCCRRRRL